MAKTPSPDVTVTAATEPEEVTIEVTRRPTRPQFDSATLRQLAPERGWNKGSKVCIVGFTEHRKVAPFDDPSFEIWGCNKLWQHMEGPFDRIYDPHSVSEIRQSDPDQLAWLRKGGTPAYVVAAQEDWPDSVTLPAAQLRSSRDYFTNTISWMIAHALYEGPPSDLWVVGVDMAVDSEYQSQRPSCEFWLGVAEAMGVKVRLPLESDLLKCSVAYGVEDDYAYYAKHKARQTELEGRLAAAQAQLGQVDSSYNAQRLQLVNLIGQCQGAIEQIRYDLSVWHPPRTEAGLARLTAASDGKASK